MINKFKFILLFCLICGLFIPLNIFAKSISDYRDEIADLEKEKEKSEANSEAVQEKIDQTKAEMNEISRKIAEVIKEQKNTEEEIETLEKDIETKEQEIKDLLAFYQVSESENFYLKYIFGAESFEDFIYRFSVAEQLAEANDKLVDEMNDLIKENEKKIDELADQQKELDKLDKQAASKLETLGKEKEKFMEFSLSYDEKIAILEKQINYYKKQGCGENEDFSICMSGANIPSASGFIRPTSHGYIMNDGLSEFGWRIHPIYGYWKFHEGMDINGLSTDTPILASATGTVAYTGVWGGGGNTVILYHNVNGTPYTTMYMHLNSISVSMGEVVSQGQQIGGAGTTGNSTGVHLHFQVISGNRSYYSSDQLINPRNVVNFPNTGVWW